MRILGIETSCDETAASVIENGTKIISNITATSAGIHARTGGVIPEDAARKQLESILPVITLALKEANLSPEKIDAIAVTVGPGLIGSLLVGVETAKTLSYLWDKPIVPVNHLVGHIYANFISPERSDGGWRPPEFPLIALVVSGGHTDLVLMKNHGKIEWIGGTRDDAAGEAFDKIARLLGLPYPGGANLAGEAQKFIDKNPDYRLNLFPRPMINEDNFDWSFSGLKTAVLTSLKDLIKSKNLKLSDYKAIASSPKVQKEKSRIAAEVQEAIVEVLVEKSIKAIKKYKPKSFLLAGGVAANKALKNTFEERITSRLTSAGLTENFLHVPIPKLCTDNAAYIAAAANFSYHPVDWQKINAKPELTITDQVEV